MCAGKTGIKNFTRAFGKFGSHLQEKERPLSMDEKFKAVDDCGLNGIEKKQTPEDFSLSGDYPAKKDEENKCEMTSKVGEPGQGIIKDRMAPPSICPIDEF